MLFLAYKAGRVVVSGHLDSAFTNARRVWRVERALRLPNEGWLQDLLMHSDPLIRTANVYYATVHFPLTAAFLVWMYLRRPTHYLWARTALVLLTAAGFAVQVLMPLTPPRMLAAAQMVDTGTVLGPSVYGSPETDTLSNQFAAMPSLHVGWAIMVAVGIITTTRGSWRWLWVLHPVITVVVVVATANHYWLDGLVAAALLLMVLGALRAVRSASPSTPPAPCPDAPRTRLGVKHT